MHEINVIGTMNLFAAASAPGSTVRNVVVKSSALVYGTSPQDPYWYRERHRRASHAADTGVERSLLEVEGYVRDFAARQPARLRDAAALLERARPRHRHAAQQGARAAARAVGLRLRPALPVRARGRRRVARSCSSSSTRCPASTTWPATASCRGARWHSIAGKRTVPMPPFGIGLATAPLRRLGLVDLPPELIDLLKYGRGVDNRRLKQAGFHYQLHVGRHRAGLRRGAAPPPDGRRPQPGLPSTRRTWRTSSATPPRCCATGNEAIRADCQSMSTIRTEIIDRRRGRHARRARATQRTRPRHVRRDRRDARRARGRR